MRLYCIMLLVFIPLYSMQNPGAAQDPTKCPLVRLPMSTMAHILPYVIAPFCPDGFYVGKTKKARMFLTTCKHYYTSKELTQAIIAQLANEYGLPRVFVFAPLYLGTPKAYECLTEWLNTTTEINRFGDIKLVPSKEKIDSLDEFLKEVSHANLNPNGSIYTPGQRQHITDKILTIKSLVQTNCLAP